MVQIELNGMEFQSHIGHYDEEKQVSNSFLVDLIIDVNSHKAAISDDLNDALDYQSVYLVVKTEMAKKCNLLENVANRILNSLANKFSLIASAKIIVSKINPSLGGKINKVSVMMKI